jgi:hypothetical protein
MKRILILLFLASGIAANAQLYNNEWIDYNKTYYKFKIAVTGLYRISQPTLSTIGLGSTPAEQFQLWRNGKEIPLYTTVQTGAMGSSDYIEFWGEMNDGKPDNDLYRQPQFQLSDKWSLLTDTAAYFLTVNQSGNNLRLVPTPNNVAGNSLLPDSFFMHTTGKYWRDKINPGRAEDVVEYVYSSSYDQGEGWTSVDFYPGTNNSLDVQNNLNVYTGPGAPTPRFKINVCGNAYNPRLFRVRLNGDSLVGGTMNYFDFIRADVPFNLSLISSGTASVELTNLSTITTDRMVVGQYEIVYPRQFNFGNARNFYFELPANTNGNFLQITNFNYNGVAPVLYDLTNGKRYVGDITNPSLIKFALLPSSVNRKLMLVSEDAGNILTVTSFQQRTFQNFGLAANQGNYLIITSPVLNNGSNGSHPVDDYKNYRSSAAGGSYNVKTYMVSELVDQFGLGIKMHPLSIRNFIRWARTNFTSSVKDILLIGKGVTYNQFRLNESNANIDNLNFVPTYGQPASDMLLTAAPGTSIPLTPIGRISVISGDELTDYLNKVKEYELAQAFSSPLIQDKEWMKNVVHVIGASDPNLGATLLNYMNYYKAIIQDTSFGANVHTFTKSSSDPVQQLNNARMQTLFQQGISLLTYFGHSSSSTLDFNLETPQQYNNPGKYPVMIVMGCNAGNFYNFNTVRLQSKETLSEKFLLAQQRGAIAFVASTSLSVVPYLDIYNTATYKSISSNYYDKTLGEVFIESVNRVFNITSTNDFFARFHCEQTTLHGDPALHLNTFSKPDYVIEDPLVKVSPSFISVAETHFQVDAKFKNIGKAVARNIVVEMKRTYPNNTTEVIRRDTIPGIRYIDSLSYTIPIVPTRDKGLNKITITVDADNAVDELYENNNSVTKDVFIYEDEARPVYPYEYAIVNSQNIKVVASTANPFSPSKQYMMEMDTTELFNSPLKVTRTTTSAGGVFEFTPGITFTDSTVYYWRVAPVPASGQPNWNKSSFVYIGGYDPGYNQSHYYQHIPSAKQQIILDPATRTWKFDSLNHNLFIKNGVFFTAATQEADLVVSVDGNPYIRSACVGFSLIFNIFDPNRCVPRPNPNGAYGSALPCVSSRLWNYEFSYMTPASRKLMMDFMDSIPNGYYVVVRNILNYNQVGGFINEWKADTALYGSGNSLYHKLKNVGFNKLDSFTSARAFAFVYQKNGNAITPVSVISDGMYDNITLSQDIRTPDTIGYITSPVFGPAKAWKQLKWRGLADTIPGDMAFVDVIGVKNDGTETTLFSGLDPTQQDFDISSINAAVYPYAKLKLKTMDSLKFTPYQLRYWRLTYVPAPEGAIAPNLHFTTKDTVEVGEPLNFKVAFKNISPLPFDSMKVKLVVTDRNNVPNIIPIPRRRPLLPADDTLQVGALINTSQFAGLNSLYLDVNPDNDQPEQYHFNNFLYRSLYVKPDSLGPLMDVTFDGVHILNGDIISSRPNILVKLKDEAKWMVLDDTSLVTVQVRYPNGSLRRFYFNNDTLRFTAASPAPATNNTATINFLPYFSEDGEYELIISGKDKSNNTAGSIEYRVAFEIINKPMISNMLNYPNPFTTSTAFVFTITGSEVPQNIKIEIMTITGKIVREITKDELGPLHIGRNITEFKWDGTDQYGQKLANGIYLYRVVTNLNGKMLDKYKASGDNTDKYFNKGYGKMYLMR